MVRAAAVEAARPGCAAVLERDRECDAVGTAIAMLRSGRGGAILVEGAAGIGKTSLVEAALGALDAVGDELEVARATCDEWSRHFAFSAITAALDLDPRRSVVAQDALLAVMDELVDQVRQRCEQGPLVLVVEDLQWADDASLSVWRELCGLSANLPLLVVGSLRPGDRPTLTAKLRRDMAGCGGAILELGPLTETATIAMAAGLLGAPPGPGLRKLLGCAAGVPRHVAELVSLVSRFGMLSDGDGDGEVEVADSWADLGGPDVAVGWSKAIAARLGGVAPGALDALRGAAVAGEEFSECDLARLLSRPYEQLSEQLGELVEAGLLTRAGGGLRFQHALIRHAVYESLPVALRSALHHHLARLLVGTDAPPERIARHLLVGGHEPEPWEVDWLIENVDALADREPSTAIGMIEKVLADDGAADPRFTSLRGRLARIHLGLENYEQAEAHARSVLQGGGDAGAVGSATWTAGLSLLHLHRPDQALRLLEATAANPPAAWRARYAALRALAHNLAGRMDAAAHAAEEALVGGRAGDQIAVCCALYVRSAVRAVRSDTAGAVADVEEALPIAGSLPELAGLRVLLLGNQFIYRFAAGMHEGAVDAVRHALTVAVRLDSPWQLRLRRQAADLLYDLGLWDEAMQCLRGWRDPMEYAVAALIALHRDELPEALRNLRELETVVADTDVEHEGYSPFLYLVTVRAQYAARFGKPLGPVLAEFDGCTAPGAEDRMPQRHRVLPIVVILALQLGDTRTATTAADAAVRDAQADPTPRKRAEAEVCEGLVRAEPDRLLRAAEYFREAGLRLYAGLAREYAAELLASAGDMPGARSAMNDARAAYEAAAARWDVRRAVGRLRHFDVRRGARGPRSRPAVGAGALTPAERQVAELLAQGCPNPEIATRLYVSRRTVETHVSKILAKLQISSRRQVREHLFAAEAGERAPHSGS